MTFIFVFFLMFLVSTPDVKKFEFKRTFWFAKKLDDTDNLHTGNYSGLALYIDHGTGVHYIRSVFGGLTPRLDRHGNVVSSYQQPEIYNQSDNE